MHFGFPQRILRVLCENVEHQWRVIFEGCVAYPLTITAILPGSNWSVLFLRMVMQDAMGELLKMYPQLKIEVLQAMPKVASSKKQFIQKLKVSLAESGKERKSNTCLEPRIVSERI